MTRNIRPPTVRGGERLRERWEEEVSKKLDNTDFTLDDAFRALFLSTTSTQGQENERAVNYLARLVSDNVSLRGKVTDLDRRLKIAEKQIELQRTNKTEEVKRKLNDVEVLAWL